ncbi:MAG: portal protein, partial [Dehalococcoidia bacterium]
MDDRPFPQQLIHRDQERLRGYQESLDFYAGLQWQGTPRRGERRLTFNYVRVLLEKATSYLLSSLTFALEPLEDTAEARRRALAAEQAVRELAEANGLEQLDF